MKTHTNRFYFHGLIVLFSMLSAGFLATLLGKELSWDLANYHYYNAFAFLHHRYHVDYWPAIFFHQYLNPVLDLFSYYLINTMSPKETVFILGAIHGLIFWLIFLIARLFITEKYRNSLAFVIALTGIYAPTVLTAIGAIQNDNSVAIVLLIYLYFQLRALKTKSNSIVLLCLPGIFLGMAIGLKFTAASYAIGANVAWLLYPNSFKEKLKIVILLNLAIIFGLFITNGYWMMMMWREHHNPFYPFLNGIFHSDHFPQANWRETRFQPQNIWQTIFFPFYFCVNSQTNATPCFDLRYLFLYILFVLFAIKKLTYRSEQTQKSDPIAIWLFWFCIFSYFVWEYLYPIMRYLVFLEIVAPLIIYLLIKELTPSYRFYYFFGIITVIVIFMMPETLVRKNWYDHSYFNVSMPVLSSNTNATVLIPFPSFAVNLEPRPLAYLIPFLPEKWDFIGVPFLQEEYVADPGMLQAIARRKQANQKFYLLSSALFLKKMDNKLHAIGFSVDAAHCQIITSDRQLMTDQYAFLCPLKS